MGDKAYEINEIEWYGAKAEIEGTVKRAKCGCYVIYDEPCIVKACKPEHKETIDKVLEALPQMQAILHEEVSLDIESGA
jgi:hypothetical protein